MRRKVIKLSKKQAKYHKKISAQRPFVIQKSPINVAPKTPVTPKVLTIPKLIGVRQLAELFHMPAAQLITLLLKNGIAVNINQSVDFETASLVAEDLGFTAQLTTLSREIKEEQSSTQDLRPRPPVVTIMGHVDHGKTTLLDAIRQTNIAGLESGGITQHIGAYQVGSITFLDTPGHEAFANIRAHGASVTDIVVLVVAADEGVKPQTLEALSHAKAANVPIIVVLTKIDLPTANLEMVRRQLSEAGLKPDTWGGDTPFVEVSATKNTNISLLLDTIKLVASLSELKSSYSGPASGVAIESKMTPGVGPVSTVLVQRGRLQVGDKIMFESTSGKVRTMETWQKQKVTQATPSMPVQISGIKSLPSFGEQFTVLNPHENAKLLVEASQQAIRHYKKHTKRDDVVRSVIIKTDTSGSLESIRYIFEDFATKGIRFNIVHSTVGDINESDIHLAKISDAWIIGFRVKILPFLKPLIQQTNVNVSLFSVIYDLITELEQQRLQSTEVTPAPLANEAVILNVFRDDDRSSLIGIRVQRGIIRKNNPVQVIRSGKIIGSGTISSIRQMKTPITQAKTNLEVGLELKKTSGVDRWSPQPDDRLEVVAKSLMPSR